MHNVIDLRFLLMKETPKQVTHGHSLTRGHSRPSTFVVEVANLLVCMRGKTRVHATRRAGTIGAAQCGWHAIRKVGQQERDDTRKALNIQTLADREHAMAKIAQERTPLHCFIVVVFFCLFSATASSNFEFPLVYMSLEGLKQGKVEARLWPRTHTRTQTHSSVFA